MKKSMIALTLLAAVGCAPANAAFDTPHKRCSAMSGFAEAMMSERQAGVPIRELLEKNSSDVRIVGIISMAYDSPLWASAEFKKRAATEYGNVWYKSCMQLEAEKAK